MDEVKIKGKHTIEVRDKKGKIAKAELDIKFKRILIHPPIGKSKNYPSLKLTVIHAQETKKPKGRERINWKLITDLPINTKKEAIEKLKWYALRWKIETFHKILKSGCKAEESKLRTAQRLTNLISIFCILSWRIFWTTMIQRAEPHAPATLALTPLELQILDSLIKSSVDSKKDISFYLQKIAQLGGYLARKHDPPPGNKVVWKGMCRLVDIELGFILGAKLMGN